MVDALSKGRSGLSLASGWRAVDFLLRPEAYQDRRQLTVDGIDVLRRLWRGEPYVDESGAEHQVFPRPVTTEPRLWLTSAGNPDTFETAGKSGVGVLTHLLSHSLDQLAPKIARYRRSYVASGRPGRGHVVLMIHTYLDQNFDIAARVCRQPLIQYLATSLDLGVSVPASQAGRLTPRRMQVVAENACDRYLERDGLFGSVQNALSTVSRIAAADVDEIACLIDFGVATETALTALNRLAELKAAAP
jgi:natural product biosynthesis luciferase-like monooxygenase protein